MGERIDVWFPKSVYVVDEFKNNLISDLEKEIKGLSIPVSKSSTLFVRSSHTTNRKLHHRKVFKELSDNILLHVRQYATSLGYSENFTNRCHMHDMWYNISGKGDFIFPHSHPGSFFSGVFYVKVSPDNKIFFYDKLDMSVELPDTPNNLSFSNVYYNCIPSRLLIFKSDFVHGVPIQETEGEKIAISFNVLFYPIIESDLD